MDYVVITGAASGIGLATTQLFVDESISVIGVDVAQAHTADAAGTAGSGACELVNADITSRTDLELLAQRCNRRPGRLLGIVNCAGVAAVTPFADTSESLMRRMFDINVIGTMLINQALSPVMIAGGGGSIVNMASVSGMVGNVGRAAYGASKGALIALTKVMAAELAPDHIRVNAIAPGPISTPLTDESHGQSTQEAWLDAVPLGRYGLPAEVAASAAFLLDEERSSFITGQVIVVDGGFSGCGVRA